MFSLWPTGENPTDATIEYAMVADFDDLVDELVIADEMPTSGEDLDALLATGPQDDDHRVTNPTIRVVVLAETQTTSITFVLLHPDGERYIVLGVARSPMFVPQDEIGDVVDHILIERLFDGHDKPSRHSANELLQPADIDDVIPYIRSAIQRQSPMTLN